MPFNSLRDVKKMLRKGHFRIQPNAQMDARRDFGWETKDIKQALLNLTDSQCYSSKTHETVPIAVVDYYRAPKLKDNEDVYTHFYVQQHCVVINSFKALGKGKT